MSELIQVEASSGNELTDAELMQVQGGGILAHAVDWLLRRIPRNPPRR